MEDGRSPKLTRYFGHALLATLSVTVLPAAAVTALEMRGYVQSDVVALALGAALSILIAAVGARLWARRPGSRDIVFSDLMLWGLARRLRTERRLAEARGILGLSARGTLESELEGDRAAAVLEQLGAALEARDVYTHGHSKRVTRHAHMIASAMGLSDEQVAKVRTAAAVHDVGKVRTPRSVLNKPRRLNAVQQKLMNRHAADGAKMVESIGDPEVTAMVRHHHERLDGEGYPDRLRGDEIPLGARIIAVADTFDAMTSARAYRPAMRHSRALKVLRADAGTQLDPAAVAAFVEYYRGQRSVAWWAIWTTAPQRLAAWIGSLLNTAGAASLSQSVAAIGTAAAIAGGAADTTRHERDAHRAAGGGSPVAHVAPAAYETGGNAIVEEDIPALLPETVTSSPGHAPSHHSRDGDGADHPADGVPPHSSEGVPPAAPPKPPKSEKVDGKPERDTGGEPVPGKKEKDADPVAAPEPAPGKKPDKAPPPDQGPKPKPAPVDAPAAPAPPKQPGPKKPKP